jgi:serine/threonine protein kinase/Tfp pilus assembly protein PilF
MTPKRWQEINDLFHSAVERTPEDRAAFLEEACHGDESLRREIEAFIALDERAENFIETSAFEVAPELLTNDDAGALVGESIGHYRILSLIGVGGMGEVYLARDELLGRKVALKFLPQSLTADEVQLNRLEYEARTASALNHPNILTVHEIGVDGSRHFIATEFIEGETLRAVLARGKLDLLEALDIALQVGSALAAAHKSGVLHRDIKPENIMLRPDGYAKVLDFGIAKLTDQQPALDNHGIATSAVLETRSGLVIGTVRYMSPEQARDEPVDARTDIWSFGVILYEMLAGTPPFEGQRPSDCIAAVLKNEPSWPVLEARQVPALLEQIIRKALRKDKEERYQSVEEMLTDLRRLKEVSESTVRGRKQQAKLIVLTASVAAVLVLVVAVLYLRGTQTVTNFSFGNASRIASAIPERSIAVLPFENLSHDPDNAFFADGVQDQVLTNLAQIADLKVISRTSVMQYKSGAPRNLREIGQQLGVGRVVEGSVQRDGNRVRVTAQLLDARNHAHLWAQTYDRNLADVFAIQSEIAKAIADQLQARLSPNEKKAIEQPPTSDVAAFDLYSRARTLSLASFSSRLATILRESVDLLNQAVAHDPSFFLAHCELVRAHDQLYSQGHDHSPARLALADAALEAAIRLRPDAGDTRLARAGHLYRGYRDHDGALAELEIARRTLPNDPRVFELTGYILRRRGQQEEGLRNLERAVELDPRNFFTLQQIALSYFLLRRYSEEAAILDRALSIRPDDTDTKIARAYISLNERGDTRPLHQTIDEIRAKDPEAIKSVADDWLLCALAERDVGNAQNALVALGDNFIGDDAVHLSRDFGEGLLARMVNDKARAHAAFTAARTEQEKRVQAQPDYGPALCILGLIDAGLGRKEEALREGRRAIELLPVEKDSVNGAHMVEYFAITAAWVGEEDLAYDQLAKAVPLSGAYLSYGGLKLLPYWDPLRGDPRFEKIVASLAPKK